MIAALVVALALQGDPLIEKVERLAGDVNRPLLWTPLKITVSSAAGFSGDVVARSGFGFQTAKRIQLASGGRGTILLPAIDPREIVAGTAVHKLSRDFLRPDRIVLVDTRLPYASELVSSPQILYQKIGAEDLESTRPRGLLELADIVLTKDGPATREEAEKAVADLGESPAQLEAVDRALWPLAPREGWVPPKKGGALYFAVVYAFVSFVALTVVARRFPKFGLACVVVVVVLGIGYSVTLFPRRQVWVVSERVQNIGPAGQREIRVWFVNSAADVETSIQFPQLVKPIFSTSGGTDDPFTIRVEERGCRVDGLKLGPTRSACFGTGGPFAPTAVSPVEGPRPLLGAVLVRSGRARFLGDLPEGTPIPEAADGENPVHRSPAYDGWSRFVGKEGLLGIQGRAAVPSGDLSGPDLADERERPRTFIRSWR
ncbi:MAG TPA: hypothetical protein VKW04_11060 [Planctomycetota bacterium]|nr:hypothetical protein [Planctomycetota bacterium]